ncbi:cysteine desulfurase family protein [Candidatus Vidania fulgoroideorum]
MNNKKIIYFDNASSTKPYYTVIKKMKNSLSKNYANCNSKHILGLFSKIRMEKIIFKISNILNCNYKDLTFTSGSTESNNLAIKGLIKNKNNKIKKVMSFENEHSSIIEVLKEIENYGYKIFLEKINSKGNININNLERKIISEKIDLLSISWVNGEIGTINNIYKICEICNNNNTFIHIDATHAFGKIKININKIKADLISFSFNKSHGPKGGGILYVNENLSFSSEIKGGNQQKFRSGTIPLYILEGIYESMKISTINFEENIKKISYIYNFLKKKIVKLGGKINGDEVNRIPHNLNFQINNLNKKIIKKMKKFFAFSQGATCDDFFKKKSHVLKSIGLKKNEIKKSIRISLGNNNKIHEAKFFIKKLNFFLKN